MATLVAVVAKALAVVAKRVVIAKAVAAAAAGAAVAMINDGRIACVR